MNILTVDFECFFDNEYTLTKLTTEAYIRDPRFEAHGVGLYASGLGVVSGKGDGVWIAQPKREVFDGLVDWENTAVLCHHAAFDGLILSHHYGIIPGRWLDTMSMAAYLWPSERKSLSEVARRMGLPEKQEPYMKGVHYADMSREQQRELADACLQHCELTYSIFTKMMSGDY